MISYQTIILKFAKKGEKTGWSYVEIPADVAEKLMPGRKTSFQIKGLIDGAPLKQKSLIPIGKGNFILPLKSDLRSLIKKRKGDEVVLKIDADKSEYEIDADFAECLADAPEAKYFFESLPGSHRKYFSKWIEGAKTNATKAKRIGMAVMALSKQLGFAEMIRASKKQD